MSLTVFGVIWLIILTVCICIPDIRPMIFITLFGMIFQSNNILILGGVTGIGPQIITSGLFILKSYTYKTRKISHYNKAVLLSLATLVIYIIFASSFLTENKTEFTQIAMLLVYLICAWRMAKCSHLVKQEYIKKTIDFIIDFVLIIGFWCLLERLGVVPQTGLLKTFIYNDTLSGVVDYNVSPEIQRFYSTFLEPSYCSGFLVGALFYQLILGDYNRKRVLFLVLAIALTQSATAYAALMVVFAIYLTSKADKKALKFIIPIGGFISLIVCSVYGNNLIQSIYRKLQTGSGRVRSNWNLAATNAFYRSPIWGTGYKSQRASSLFFTILGELGLVGIILFLITVIILLALGVYNNGQTKHFYAGTFWVLSVLACQLIACPDLSLCVYWFALYVLVITSNFTCDVDTDPYKPLFIVRIGRRV